MTIINREIVAAFDFDGTLTRRDSLLPFLWHALGAGRFLLNMVLLSPVLMLFTAGLLRNDRAKEAVLRRCLGGRTLASLQSAFTGFAQERLPSLLRPTAYARFRWHKAQGHTCVVVSASLAHYLLPWAERSGFDHVIASELATDNEGRITGRLVGGNCYGPEKARRLRELIDRKGATLGYAYGDSRGDREMLALAEQPFYRSMPEVGRA